jgi:hypothetical protein
MLDPALPEADPRGRSAPATPQIRLIFVDALIISIFLGDMKRSARISGPATDEQLTLS